MTSSLMLSPLIFTNHDVFHRGNCCKNVCLARPSPLLAFPSIHMLLKIVARGGKRGEFNEPALYMGDDG